MSLAIAWSFFHKLYEQDSELSRNFLVIAPNIIVLNRLYHDFQGLRIFFEDPVLPDNRFGGRNWRDDFQLTLHVQDEVLATRATGNIFLTNIHRVYSSDQSLPSPDDENSMDYFLGNKPTEATTDSKTVMETFKYAINDLTIQDSGDAQLIETTRAQDARPFMVKEQEYLVPQKSVFNRITGDSHFELEFAAFLENCSDVVSYVKNYLSFKLDYVNADGDISNYYPDFLVKLMDGRVVVVETKGREDLDVPLKTRRLAQWCEDVNNLSPNVTHDFVYVDQERFDVYRPETFHQLLDSFTEYKT